MHAAAAQAMVSQDRLFTSLAHDNLACHDAVKADRARVTSIARPLAACDGTAANCRPNSTSSREKIVSAPPRRRSVDIHQGVGHGYG
jgi:hypothetical protein